MLPAAFPYAQACGQHGRAQPILPGLRADSAYASVRFRVMSRSTVHPASWSAAFALASRCLLASIFAYHQSWLALGMVP